MKMYKATASGTNCLASPCKRLLFARNEETTDVTKFWVMQNQYSALKTCPYFTAVQVGVELAVDLEGHADPSTSKYDVAAKTTVHLPNTCIEAAEHALKSMHAGRHQAGLIANNSGAVVSMSQGQDAAFDIDSEDMNEKSYEYFRYSPDKPDARGELFSPGEGMALVYSGDPAKRKAKEWTVHAVAVLLSSTQPFDPFLIVAEEFSTDEANKKIKMGRTWKLAVYKNALDFATADEQVMPAKKYRLWKLKATAR